MQLKIIITGATGFVGEGVLLECLANNRVAEVLVVSRKPSDRNHPKLKECIVPDFMQLQDVSNQLTGYDACFYCAGVSSVGMSESNYNYITYDVTMHFARTLVALNPDMVFTFVSGSHTDSSEKGKVMWARVKGKTENALRQLSFRNVYNFRPGIMRPTPGQKNVKGVIKVIGALFPLLKVLFPKRVLTMQQVGRAMINVVIAGYGEQTLEIGDISEVAGT